MGIERVAFKLFGVEIYWYAIIITSAILLGILYAMKRAGKYGLISDKVFDTALCGLIGGFVGARLYYVIFYNLNPENDYKYSLVEVVTRIRDGGLAIYGGVLGALTFALIYMKLKKIRIAPLLDMAGVSFLLGIGVGRWGNFFNQEAYGSVVSEDYLLGMTGNRIASSVGEGVLVHPCFLYESLWCLLGFALLHFYSKKLRTFDGEMFLLFVAWYGVGRAFNEQLRSDSLMLGDFKISQLLAAISAGAAIGGFIALKIRASKNEHSRLYRDTVDSVVAIAEYDKEQRLRREKAAAKKALKEDAEAPSILGDDIPEKPEKSEEPEKQKPENTEGETENGSKNS